MHIVLTILLVVLSALFCIYLFLICVNSGPVKVVGRNKKALAFLGKGDAQITHWVHWKYGINAMYNTAAAFTQNRSKYRPEPELVKGADGGDFRIDWFVNPVKTELPANTPIVVIAHGLSGGSNEPMVQKLGLRLSTELGYRVGCVIFRGCCGLKLSTMRMYNGGYTEDFHIALKLISERYPNAPISLVGFSLGGNMIGKYLGERTSKNHPFLEYDHIKNPSPIPANVKNAICVGCPFDLVKMDKLMKDDAQLFNGKGIVKYIQKHEYIFKKLPQYEPFFQKGDFRTRTIDATFTAPLFGYPDTETFYRDASCSTFFDGIKIPTLFISSMNDPISLKEALDIDMIDANPNTSLLLTRGGGHLGFFSFLKTSVCFDEDIIIQSLEHDYHLAKTE
ncbi:putative Medium-chain fatty acid ethyl ester synthase/esterase 2 [Blattamonas nauphoetae]|uniref:Medium-chain fatty acid ethyl ester synthase/esterase 2 n=1 Tax=Blattamonas nauphoetae TaxID=2049346 RepID=A0ABQ9YE93_9EUKA|nr:putative Medium-chain fatty acid ethyl ester synthase/esterase 2 [Blattamonas nauphoetae]